MESGEIGKSDPVIFGNRRSKRLIRQDIPGLRAILQLSSDSQNWDNHETGIERLSAISQPDGTIRVTARIKADPPAPRRFLRLAVSL